MMKSLIINLTIISLISVWHKGYAQGQAITWANFVNTSVNGNDLQKTAGSGGVWDAGATSTSILGAGLDGWVEFEANAGKIFMLGFADTNPDASFQSIDYAIYNTTTDIQVWESGTWKHTSGSYQASDKFKIERVGNTIYYKKNDVVFYTSTSSSTSSLLVDASINTLLAQISGVRILFQNPQNPPTAPTSLVANTVSGNRIDLSWVDNSSDESGFEIERSMTSGTGYSIVHTTTSNEIAFVDNGLNSSAQYFYRLRAINSGGASAYTNEVSAATYGEGEWLKEGTTLYYNEGRIGIGTSSPLAMLQIQTGTANSADNSVRLAAPALGSYVSHIHYGLTGDWIIRSASSSGKIVLQDHLGKVGIGTTTPAYKLDVNGTINATSILVNGQPINSSPPSQWTNSGSDIYFNSGVVGIGTSLPANPNNYALAVNGRIGAKEVQVENTSSVWPDYVFDFNYDLPSLDSVEAFVKMHKHLPEVPSAYQVEANGHNLGEMNVILLKKIEELTLYMIELKKENKQLKKENMDIKNSILDLKKNK